MGERTSLSLSVKYRQHPLREATLEVTEMELREIKEKRFRYLEALYKMVGGSPLRTANHHEISLRAGLSYQSSEEPFYFLQSEGLLQAQNPFGVINITHQGVKLYEATIARNYEPARYLGDVVPDHSLHIRRHRSVSLLECPAGRVTPEQASELSSASVTNIVTGKNHPKEQKPKRQVFITVIRSLERALTSTLLDSGVRFLLSKLKKWG